MTAIAIGTLSFVAAKRAEREVKQSWRDSTAILLERWIAKQGLVGGRPKSERALAELLGISQFSLNKLRNKTGPYGLHVLIAIRGPLGVTLDELLGLEPNVEAIRRILREELDAHDREQALPIAAPKRKAAR